MKETTNAVSQKIELQSLLRPELTKVGLNKDYHTFKEQLEVVDSLLINAHLEALAVDFAVEGYENARESKRRQRAKQGILALRVEVLRQMLGSPSYREFSRMIAGSDLLADFCGARDVCGIRRVAKSSLDRYAKFFTEEQQAMVHRTLIEVAGHKERVEQIDLKTPIDTAVCFVDTTCLEANIHFPVDWVLLRDVSRTLLKGTKLIRVAGIMNRMPVDPEAFARQMNRLCIEMTHTHRHKDSMRVRKQTLRKMKKLLRLIAGHAKRHRDLFASSYDTTDYSKAEAERIIQRIDAMLEKVPDVIHQAHERIIGGRLVSSEDKILSVYDEDLHVIVRGKAGKQVEFGNTLLLAENTQGLILDYKLHQACAPAEWRQLKECVGRQNQLDVPTDIEAACTDRGFTSKNIAKHLEEENIYDAICPRNPEEMARKMKDPVFVSYQRRRCSTEARISIIKQRLGIRLRSKGYKNRSLAVASCVIAHNLWKLATIIIKEKAVPLAKAA